MKVYHGSGTGFGHGFYVAKILQRAEDIAARVASWHDTTPVVTESY
jgi:hypothetical protein